MKTSDNDDRRSFLQRSALITIGIIGLPMLHNDGYAKAIRQDDSNLIIGPREGYAPQLGTLVSMLEFMRNKVINTTKGLTTEQLDFLLDEKANTIGAMLLHLAATERWYQINTFDNQTEGSWGRDIKEDFDAATNLGDKARNSIKGNSLQYYVDILNGIREHTLSEFKKRDDNWLMAIDKDWGWGKPANNYFKWFHVCEHESHHIGQINLIKGRMPS